MKTKISSALFILLTWCLLCMPARASVIYYLAAAPEQEIIEIQNDPALLAKFLYSGGPGKLDLDKMWHGLQWILSGSIGITAAPASRIILGGKEVGANLDYGKPRYFSPAEVKQIATLLSSISVADLRKNYSAKAMDAAKVYPDDWREWEREGEDVFGGLLVNFNQLLRFYQTAASAGHAVMYAWG